MFLPEIHIKTGSRAIIFFTLPEWNYAKKFIFMKKGKRFLNFEIRYNEKALILGPLIGAPLLSIVLEVLKSLGVKEIISIGWAGKIDFKLNLGDLFLPEKAFTLEGVSRLYYPGKRVFYPDKAILEKFEEKLKEREIIFKKGSIVSVDAPFVFERNSKYLDSWKNKAEALDMETSALFSVGKSLQMKVMALHFIVDEVGKFFSKRPEKEIKVKREKIFEVLKDFIEHRI